MIENQDKDLVVFFVPSTIQDDTKEKKIQIVFLQSARIYFINKDREKAIQDMKMIRWGIQQNSPLAITIKHSSTEILKVQKAPQEIVNKYRETSKNHND